LLVSFGREREREGENCWRLPTATGWTGLAWESTTSPTRGSLDQAHVWISSRRAIWPYGNMVSVSSPTSSPQGPWPLILFGAQLSYYYGAMATGRSTIIFTRATHVQSIGHL
jgi:hypothetical protein